MNREEKNSEIEFITAQIQNSAVAVFVDYRGLDVPKISTLRRNLRDKGAQGKVFKNTLLRIAANKALEAGDKAQLEKFVGLLEGPSMFIWSSDPVSSTKVLSEFAKVNKQLTVKGAWVDGTFLDDKGVEALSKMPGREETLAMLLSLLNTPATQLVRLIGTPGTQITRIIEAQRQKLAEAGA